MKKYKIFIYYLLFLLFITLGLYVLVFFSQIKLLTVSEKWIHDIYLIKKERANKIQDNRIIFLSGSNSLFSINTNIIQEKTNYNVINLGLHAGLDISFLYYILEEIIRENDIIILPLEFEYYKRGNLYNNWFIENMLNWGGEIYLSKLKITELFKFFIHTPSQLVFKRFYYSLFKRKDLKLTSLEEMSLLLPKIWEESGENNWRGYGYKSLNREGDMNIKDRLISDEIDNLEPRFNERLNISLHFFNYYNKMKNLVESKNGQLYLTYPVLLKNNKFNLKNIESSKEKIIYFENQLKIKGLNMLCEPYDLDKTKYFNGDYHLNYHGSLEFSGYLSDCILKNISLNK